MKIAVFHNFMDNIGGAEIVALTLVRELNADIYTTNVDREKIEKMGFADVCSRIYSIGHIPKQAPFRQQMALRKFRLLNLSGEYDFFIIAGDWAMSGAVNNHPNLWYAHSPLNELWEFKDFIKTELLNFWKKPIYNIWVALNRYLTLKYARSVDNWVANSLNTKNRIKKYYLKDATVIYPPVDTKKYLLDEAKNEGAKNYWLAVNRLAAHKRPGLQIEAFRQLPQENLVMVASYEAGVKQFEDCKREVEHNKPANVSILHWTDDEQLRALYAGCQGFITTAQNEDFGMTAVEAMAAGKPVIAPNDGGYIESVISGVTGQLISELDTEKLVESVLQVKNNLVDKPDFYKAACLAQAAKFDASVFIAKINEVINNQKKF